MLKMNLRRNKTSVSFKNLKDLLKDAYLYQYADIADSEEQIKGKKPKFFFTKLQWAFIVLAVLIAFFIRNGFNLDFCGYIISGLSLFVGIFFTFIIALYDKFNSIDFSQFYSSISEDKSQLGIRLKNYFKKTTVLSLYLILLSIICILLLSCTLLFDSILNQKINPIEIIRNIHSNPIWQFVMAFGIFIYRSVVLYFLLDFILITVSLSASIYDFIISEYNKVNLK